MAKSRKSFDKELMYKKIMPTNLRKSNEVAVEGIESDSKNDEKYQEGFVSINAERVYLNEIPKSVEKNSKTDNEVENISQIENILLNVEPVEIGKAIETEEIIESVESKISVESKEQKIEEQEEIEYKEKSTVQNSDIIEEKITPNEEIVEDENRVIIYNVMESLVMDKLHITLQKMNCCKCERCKDDIVAFALNILKPMYFVGTRNEIESKRDEFSKLGLEVTTAVLKAVLAIRRNPRH